jgi:hypothetical protein
LGAQLAVTEESQAQTSLVNNYIGADPARGIQSHSSDLIGYYICEYQILGYVKYN